MMNSSSDASLSDVEIYPHKATPQHVAIIMDGNSRWAKAKGLPRIAGHKEGAQAVKRAIRAAADKQVQWLTLYAFSSENWRREPEEVADLTSLLRYYLKYEARQLYKDGICVRIIGERSRFDSKLQKEFQSIEEMTRDNKRLFLTLALSYGGKNEIVCAAQQLFLNIQQGILTVNDISEEMFSRYMFAPDIPDPDLILRTSGEYRLSNFLLWQSAYAELIFIDTLWPDFNEKHFNDVLEIYIRRERRFGARPGIKK